MNLKMIELTQDELEMVLAEREKKKKEAERQKALNEACEMIIAGYEKLIANGGNMKINECGYVSTSSKVKMLRVCGNNIRVVFEK